MNKIVRTKPYIPEADKVEIMNRFQDILDTGMFIQGKYVAELEELVANYCGVKHAVATNSGATALEVMLRADGLSNSKVLVPTQTFVASVSAIVRSGNIPVISEINTDTQCIDLEIVKKYHTTHDISAVMLVHMAGVITPDIEEIEAYCAEHNISVYGDASHAMGSAIGNRMAGSFGTAEAFSLFATKIVTTGEGGIITTNDDYLAESARLLRNHGCTRHEPPEPIYTGLDYGVNCTEVSSNYRMPELCAAVGVSQMKRVDEFIDKRNILAKRYYNNLKKYDLILPNPNVEHQRMSWWQYIVVLPEDKTHRSSDETMKDAYRLLEGEYVPTPREEICLILRENGVPTANAYFPPCHYQEAFEEYIHDADWPVHYFKTEDLLFSHIALPMYVEMTLDQVDEVCYQLLKAVYEK